MPRRIDTRTFLRRVLLASEKHYPFRIIMLRSSELASHQYGDFILEQETADALSNAATAISEAASAIATAATSGTASSFFSWGQVSFGALFGTLVGALVAFFIRRYFAKKDESELASKRLRETAIELHDRFNSKEVLEARAEAEEFLLGHVGEKFTNIRGEDKRIKSVWLVAREYEFLSVAIEEKIADEDLIAKYAFEIFVYWLQHFRFGFEGEVFDTVKRIRALEDFFKRHPSTKDRWQEIEDRQRAHINSLLEAEQKPRFDFTTAKPLPAWE